MTVLLVYAVFFFLILRFCVVLFNFLSNPKLPHAPRNYYDEVSILIPGFTDLSQLSRLVQSIREQDFPNYEVLIYAREHFREAKQLTNIFSRGSERFVVYSEAELPGAKEDDPNELSRRLAARAQGDYYLFLDRVEELEPGMIYNALYRMKLHSLSMLSLLADQKMKSFGEGLATPLVNYLFFSLLPLRLILLSSSRFFAGACAQCLFFRAEQYRSFQWHVQDKGGAADGTSIMRKVKELGFRAETLLANAYVTGRMYSGLKDGIRGLERKLRSGFRGNVLALLLFLLLCGPAYLLILPMVSMQLLGLALTLLFGMRLMTSLMGNQPVWWNLLFHPLQVLVLIAALGTSVFRIVRKFA